VKSRNPEFCLDVARLDALLERLPYLTLLVVGDFFLDKYLVVDRALSEVSIETGLEAYQVVEQYSSPGAAGTVMNNLSALGVGTLLALGVCGEDGEGCELRRGLQARRVDTEHLVGSARCFTPTYLKPLEQRSGVQESGDRRPPTTDHRPPAEPPERLNARTPERLPRREMERFDTKNRVPLAAELEAEILARLRRVVGEVDGVIIADQVQERDCGVVTDRVRAALAALGERYPGKVFLADSRVRIGEFRGVSVKPNRAEAAAALGEASGGEIAVEEARELARRLCAQNGRPAFVTLGAEGMLVAEPGGVTHVPGVPVTGEIDIVGAGDSATAGIVSALCAGATPAEAALVGNLVASITVQQIGTTGTASPEQVRARFRSLHAGV
jgi:bifunctional ADP-heptose synthase (sugar kinase/adenylyltransferase)